MACIFSFQHKDVWFHEISCGTSICFPSEYMLSMITLTLSVTLWGNTRSYLDSWYSTVTELDSRSHHSKPDHFFWCGNPIRILRILRYQIKFFIQLTPVLSFVKFWPRCFCFENKNKTKNQTTTKQNKTSINLEQN